MGAIGGVRTSFRESECRADCLSGSAQHPLLNYQGRLKPGLQCWVALEHSKETRAFVVCADV